MGHACISQAAVKVITSSVVLFQLAGPMRFGSSPAAWRVTSDGLSAVALCRATVRLVFHGLSAESLQVLASPSHSQPHLGHPGHFGFWAEAKEGSEGRKGCLVTVTGDKQQWAPWKPDARGTQSCPKHAEAAGKRCGLWKSNFLCCSFPAFRRRCKSCIIMCRFATPFRLRDRAGLLVYHKEEQVAIWLGDGSSYSATRR